MTEAGAPDGAYTSHGVGHGFAHLSPGRRYKVVKAFTDFDGQVHAVGETWTYLGTAFLPYDDGRSIFVSFGGDSDFHIRMQDRPEEQGPILDRLLDYIEAAD